MLNYEGTNNLEWSVDQAGGVGAYIEGVGGKVSHLTDKDVVHGLSMWKNNSDFLGRIFMQQADRLGFSDEEKQSIFKGISKKDITKLIQFNIHSEGSQSMQDSAFGSLQLHKLVSSVGNYAELLHCIFHTQGIIEVYPARADEVVHVYTVLNHEINHLLMMGLYIFRSEKKGVPLEQTIQRCASKEFDKVTETLAWLDGGQVPLGLASIDDGRIARYVGWQKGGIYNLADSYEMAKLRSYRIHVLQIKIHNLPDTTTVQYQNWCKRIREILFDGINQPEYLTLIDEYLTGISSPQQARDQLLNLQ